MTESTEFFQQRHADIANGLGSFGRGHCYDVVHGREDCADVVVLGGQFVLSPLLATEPRNLE
jgi:hypothetical protein